MEEEQKAKGKNEGTFSKLKAKMGGLLSSKQLRVMTCSEHLCE